MDESILIGRLRGLDYGAGMASSFYHGYLKFVLPEYGDKQKNLKDLILDYEAKEGVKHYCKKDKSKKRLYF